LESIIAGGESLGEKKTKKGAKVHFRFWIVDLRFRLRQKVKPIGQKGRFIFVWRQAVQFCFDNGPI
jgi:hypothetical protein